MSKQIVTWLHVYFVALIIVLHLLQKWQWWHKWCKVRKCAAVSHRQEVGEDQEGPLTLHCDWWQWEAAKDRDRQWPCRKRVEHRRCQGYDADHHLYWFCEMSHLVHQDACSQIKISHKHVTEVTKITISEAKYLTCEIFIGFNLYGICANLSPHKYTPFVCCEKLACLFSWLKLPMKIFFSKLFFFFYITCNKECVF